MQIVAIFPMGLSLSHHAVLNWFQSNNPNVLLRKTQWSLPPSKIMLKKKRSKKKNCPVSPRRVSWVWWFWLLDFVYSYVCFRKMKQEGKKIRCGGPTGSNSKQRMRSWIKQALLDGMNDEGEWHTSTDDHIILSLKKDKKVQAAEDKQPWQTLLGKRQVRTHPWLEGEAVEILKRNTKGGYLPARIRAHKELFLSPTAAQSSPTGIRQLQQNIAEKYTNLLLKLTCNVLVLHCK